MKKCMELTPVDDITVRQIVEGCNLTRQTFYRNFLDKYDLINWYFDKLLRESFVRMGNGETVYEGLIKKFDFIKKEQVFFSAAFRSDDQNSLKQHDFKEIYSFYIKLIEKKTGEKMKEEFLFPLELYCQGSIDMTVKWVLNGMKTSTETMARLLVESMPAKLEKLFQEFSI
ncbi:MAG: TetR family transcriptional regulator [Lachnospiraceae bacterium]|nr:TetR family transcriptional regulator [Lachnospiraceae bacterium]